MNKNITIVIIVLVLVVGGLVFFKNQSVEAPAGKLPAGSVPAGDFDRAKDQVWTWEKTVMGDGTTVLPKKAEAFTITFASDNKVSGTTDCNRFGGSYQVGSDGILTLGSLVSTKMFCEGSQEEEFTTAVAKTGHYIIDEAGNLALLLSADSGTIFFKKNQ